MVCEDGKSILMRGMCWNGGVMDVCLLYKNSIKVNCLIDKTDINCSTTILYVMEMLRKIEGKRPLGRPRHRWDNCIRMGLGEIDWGCVAN
jgi:hypothetical protein